jgi:two-component system sensor histidine kinase PilS (NtrC family)
VFQDLTEIRRLEHEVRMKEKLAAVGEMAAHLAHEIRNPLGAISGSAQMLMAEPNISADQERLLAIITRESKRLSDALSHFLLQTKPAPIERSPVDVGPVIGAAVALLRNSSELGPLHRVEFQSDGGSHVCLADPDQITQVFWNLVRNALEAMPEGGVLSIRLASHDSEVILSVRDQGRGIGREEQRRLFEPFRSGTRMGTGLGLAIVYRIVREHHGDISVRSVPSRGTEVEVRLPLVAVPATA